MPDNGGCRVHRGIERVAKHQGSKGGRAHLRIGQKDGRDCACLFQLFPVPDNGGYRAHRGIERVAKHQGSKDGRVHLWVEQKEGGGARNVMTHDLASNTLTSSLDHLLKARNLLENSGIQNLLFANV